MFEIGWSELLLIGIVALIAIGPKELPGVLRTVGQWMTKIRRMASEFQGQFQEAMREAEMAELKKQVDDMANTASNFTNFDPLDKVRKEVDGIRDGLNDAISDKPKDTSVASAPADVTGGTLSEPAAAPPPVATPPATDTAQLLPTAAPNDLPPEPLAAPATPASNPTPASPPPTSSSPPKSGEGA
jgi:sec-independent protein translocase protein TatB